MSISIPQLHIINKYDLATNFSIPLEDLTNKTRDTLISNFGRSFKTLEETVTLLQQLEDNTIKTQATSNPIIAKKLRHLERRSKFLQALKKFETSSRLKERQNTATQNTLAFILHQTDPYSYVHAATGTGKNFTYAEMIQEFIKIYPEVRILIVCPDKTSLTNNIEQLDKRGIKHGVIGDNKRELNSNITVAIINSVRSLTQEGKFPEYFDFTCIDEPHKRFLGEKNQQLFQYLDTIGVGYTATPILSKKKVSDVLGDVLYEHFLEDAIRSGEIPKPNIEHTLSIDTKQFEILKQYIQGEDYSEEGLSKFDVRDAFPQILELFQGPFKGKRFVIFLPNVQTSKDLNKYLNEHGILSQHIDGGTPTDARKRIYDQFEEGNIQNICNCKLIVESRDSEYIEGVMVLKVTRSAAEYLQMIGRAFHGKFVEETFIVDLTDTAQKLFDDSTHITSRGLFMSTELAKANEQTGETEIIMQSKSGSKTTKSLSSQDTKIPLKEILFFYDTKPLYDVKYLKKIYAQFAQKLGININELITNIYEYKNTSAEAKILLKKKPRFEGINIKEKFLHLTISEFIMLLETIKMIGKMLTFEQILSTIDLSPYTRISGDIEDILIDTLISPEEEYKEIIFDNNSRFLRKYAKLYPQRNDNMDLVKQAMIQGARIYKELGGKQTYRMNIKLFYSRFIPSFLMTTPEIPAYHGYDRLTKTKGDGAKYHLTGFTDDQEKTIDEAYNTLVNNIYPTQGYISSTDIDIALSQTSILIPKLDSALLYVIHRRNDVAEVLKDLEEMVKENKVRQDTYEKIKQILNSSNKDTELEAAEHTLLKSVLGKMLKRDPKKWEGTIGYMELSGSVNQLYSGLIEKYGSDPLLNPHLIINDEGNRGDIEDIDSFHNHDERYENFIQDIKRVITNTLSEKEAKILTGFYGISTPPQTLEELTSPIGLKKERIRQIRGEAAIRIRKNKKASNILKPYLTHTIGQDPDNAHIPLNLDYSIKIKDIGALDGTIKFKLKTLNIRSIKQLNKKTRSQLLKRGLTQGEIEKLNRIPGIFIQQEKTAPEGAAGFEENNEED